MTNIVKIINTPEKILQGHYEKIAQLFKPDYSLAGTFYVGEYSIEKRDESGRLARYGTLKIEKNNTDIIINGDQTRFIDIANEIEKLGYSVTIID